MIGSEIVQTSHEHFSLLESLLEIIPKPGSMLMQNCQVKEIQTSLKKEDGGNLFILPGYLQFHLKG